MERRINKIEKDIVHLSKSLESHTNNLYEIKFILKELKLIDKLQKKKKKKAIENLDKLNKYKEDLIEKKDKEAGKFKWFIITSFYSIVLSIIIYILKGK